MAHVIERLEHPGAAAAWLDARRGLEIGFVPTMGALHAGHLALVSRARAENDLVVVSVFVNPLQFDDAGDLAAYPRDLERDAELLAEAGCDLVFTGSLLGPGGFFPECASTGTIPAVEPGPAALGLEGDVRAGHFEGVATIVRRLFETVRPARAYFGAKDFQQTLVVKHLAVRMGRDAPEIMVCPTAREANGLARSSRNERLAPWTRAAAGVLRRALGAGAERWAAGERDAEALGCELRRAFEREAPAAFALDYLELRDPENWSAERPTGPMQRAVALIAVRVPGRSGGSVRLIDNLDLADLAEIGAAARAGLDPAATAWVTCLAPAKLNPELRVLGKRPDGFHEVDLTMLAIDLVDRVSVGWIDDGVVRDGVSLAESIRVGLSGPAASVDVPADGSNLAARAAGLVLRELDGELPTGRVVVHIDKRIPSRAGLGGGSSDAAAALLGALELVRQLGLGLGVAGLAGESPLVAGLAELGSDCAFFLGATGFARCRGRGERVEPLDSKAHEGQLFTVVTPDIECPTGQVFGALEGGRAGLPSAWRNDLEAAALAAVPQLARFRDKLLELGGSWRLAGSGSSFFRVETQPPTPEELGDLAVRLGRLRYCGVHRLFGSGVRIEAAFGPTTGGGASPQQSPEPTGAAIEEPGR